ncbi:MAG TPA: hypothetical protein VGJ91_07470, partial [Polyangiaceae bacterium]
MPTYGSQTRGNPERLRTFLRASIGDAKVLNPIINSNAIANEIIEDNLFEGLVNDDENLKVVRGLSDHWEITEEAYLAALPARSLPDGRPATASNISSLVEAAWRGARLAGLEASIQGLE